MTSSEICSYSGRILQCRRLEWSLEETNVLWTPLQQIHPAGASCTRKHTTINILDKWLQLEGGLRISWKQRVSHPMRNMCVTSSFHPARDLVGAEITVVLL